MPESVQDGSALDQSHDQENEHNNQHTTDQKEPIVLDTTKDYADSIVKEVFVVVRVIPEPPLDVVPHGEAQNEHNHVHYALDELHNELV